MLLGTHIAASELGLTPGSLRVYISTGKVQPPARREGRVMLWTPGEIAAAREALAARRGGLPTPISTASRGRP